VDPDLGAPQQSLALASRREIRTGLLEMAEHRPEEFFGKLRAAFLVGVGEAVPGWRRDTEARTSTPDLSRSQSQTSLSPMAWES
jgi:hypothetical protein